MAELLSAAQMRAVEQAAIASGTVTGLELMERAGRGVVEAVFETWPDLAATSGQAVVLCGPGNNGGDGFVIARLLHDWGWEVQVFLYGDPEKLPPDARVNYERWRALGAVAPLPFDAQPKAPEGRALLVDALFGTGLSRGLGADLAAVLSSFDRVTGTDWARVAVDCPSGLCADSGRALMVGGRGGAVFRAELTVSFHRAKLGHMLADGPRLSGVLRVCDIGLKEPPETNEAWMVEAHSFVSELSKAQDHKYNYGHALILAGPSGKGGAGRLAARGALRIGAGLVTLAPTPGAAQENAAQLNAIMLAPVGDADALSQLVEDPRMNALCIGPGLTKARAQSLVPALLAANRPTVLDADALTAFAPEELFSILHETCVLTPHAGEFARLFPDIAQKLADPANRGPTYSKLDATREAAARAGCTVLFKGPDTVIADEQGQASIHCAAHDRSAPWLATAGSGDVLAGFITGLLARGFAAKPAADAGTWLHTECARSFGPGLIAEDLPEELPKVFRALGL